jgi:hypothetical protein
MFGFVRASMPNDQDKSATLQSLAKENRIKKSCIQIKKLEFIAELQDLCIFFKKYSKPTCEDQKIRLDLHQSHVTLHFFTYSLFKLFQMFFVPCTTVLQSAPAHQRTSAPAHQRTSAPAHQRT